MSIPEFAPIYEVGMTLADSESGTVVASVAAVMTAELYVAEYGDEPEWDEEVPGWRDGYVVVINAPGNTEEPYLWAPEMGLYQYLGGDGIASEQGSTD